MAEKEMRAKRGMPLHIRSTTGLARSLGERRVGNGIDGDMLGLDGFSDLNI